MHVTEAAVRDLCTQAVFERGQHYLREGRIRRLARFGDTITAVVRGSRDYDVRVSGSATDFDTRCRCPYDGPGVCKHVVAVLLRVADEVPDDERERIEPVLERADAEDLRAFLREELKTDPALRDRLLAWFGEPTTRSVADIRAEIDRLFEETNPEYPVVFEPIDLSEFVDLAEAYRTRGAFRSAATVYRALLEGLDDNMDLVDGAYDHYTLAVRKALEGYVDAVANADLDAAAITSHVGFLEDRAASGTDYLREQFARAADELRARTEADAGA